jgi:hypothetical protein
VSAIAVNKERQLLYSKAKDLTKGTIDLSAVEGSIDHFINSAGDSVSNDVTNLNNTINTILKK